MNCSILFASNKLEKHGYIVEFLKKNGHPKTDTVSNGEEVLKYLNDHTPDFAIFDTDTPILDGFHLCKLMKSSLYEHCKEVPVILISDSPRSNLVSQLAISVGAYSILQTPFTLEEILILIQKKLNPNKITKEKAKEFKFKIKMMVAAGNPDTSQMLGNHIKEKGYDVLTASNENETLQLLQTEKPAIIFLDIDLQVSSISTLPKRIKEVVPEIFITILTPHGSEKNAIELIKAGANDYVIKPSDTGMVPEAFNETLKKYNLNLIDGHLYEEELKLHAMIDGIMDGIILVDKNRRINLVNRAGNEMLNFLVLRRTDDGTLIKINDINVKDIYHELFTKKQNSVSYEINIQKENEKHFVLIASSVNQFANENIHIDGDRRKRNRVAKVFEGENIGVVIVLRDVTREYQLRNQIVKSERLFAVSNLVAGAAHELNNPLAGIQLCSELVLNDSSISEKATKYLTRIQKETEQIQDVVKSLLTFTGNYTLSKEQLNVNEIIEEIIKQKTYQFDHTNIKTIILLGDVLPFVYVDKHQIRRVLLNIIENACAAMEGLDHEKCLTIKTEAGNNMVKIEISDTGHGIPKENISKIFEPFFTKRSNKKKKGTGLGLSIASSIIQQHNGRIYLKNTPQDGATFVIELPATQI